MKRILLRKNGWRVEIIGNDTKHVEIMYDNRGKNIITATYYDCSIDETIKKYKENGWNTNRKE